MYSMTKRRTTVLTAGINVESQGYSICYYYLFTLERDFSARTASLRSSKSVDEATLSHSFWIYEEKMKG